MSFCTEDLKITTVSTNPAVVQVTAKAGDTVELLSMGKVVARGTGPVCRLTVPKCILWSDATPKLYTCRITRGGETAEVKFGVCQSAWEGRELLVNGKQVQLRGICFRPDRGALDAENCPESLWRSVLRLKDGYFNAVYCQGQTVPGPLKEACDYYGIYLLAENAEADPLHPSLVSGPEGKKLGFLEADSVDAIGELRPACAYATTAWAMEREVRSAVRPAGQALTESWAWSGFEGQKMDVEVYALAASVELKLNGRSLGKKKTKDSKAVYKVAYAPGKLEATAFNGSGNRIASGGMESAAGQVRLCVRPEGERAKPGRAVFVPVTLEGENGAVECGADRELTICVTGGTLLAFYSAGVGDRQDADRCRTCHGRALAVVRVREDTTVTVTDGSETAQAIIRVEA